MATLTVTATTNYSGAPAETNIDRILFQTASSTSASFSRSNFGPGLIQNNVLIEGDAFINRLNVSMGTAGTFSAAGWSFANWTAPGVANADTITINGASGNDIITGSSRDDTIVAFNLLSDADSAGGGDGDDTFEINVTSLANGSEIDGGDHNLRDEIRIMNGITANLTGAKIAGVERITFSSNAGAVVTMEQIADSGIALVIGSGVNTLTVQGDAIDLTGFGFNTWDAADTVQLQGTSEIANTITGSVQRDLVTGTDKSEDIFTAGTGADTFNGGDGDDIAIYTTFLLFDAAETYNGGGDLDTLRVQGGSPYDLTSRAISNVEVLEYGSALSVTLNHDQLGAGGFATIRGSAGTDTLVLVAVGGLLDASVLNFQSWSASDIVRLSGATGGLYVGTNQDDLISGSNGIDTMQGRLGNDTYTVNAPGDTVTENANEGADTVESIIDYTLPFAVERLRLVGAASNDGTGNAAFNEIYGNTGRNILLGLDGADTIYGGDGDDTIDGGDAIDYLEGGAGDDTYVAVNGDTIVEFAGGGIDTIERTFTTSLAAFPHIENVRLIAAGAFNITGNDLPNHLTGNGSANALTGGIGNDTLVGGVGADTLTGGLDNDTYVNPGADSIVELANQGTDTVTSTVTFDLTALVHIERLFLTDVSAIDGTGNALANQMLGNDAANTINGRDGDDTINGGGGADTLNGGSGADRLIPGLQRDKVIAGADAVQDTVVFTLIGESTGVTRDILTGFDFAGEDKIDLPVIPTAFAPAIGTGSLTEGTFNVNLAGILTAAALPVGRAVLFNPDAGNLDQPGMVYLIVDANGIAGYQANQDWVFQLENHTGGLDTTDFI